MLGAPLVLSVRARLRALRDGERRSRIDPLAWLPVVVLLAAGISLSLVTRAPYEPQGIVAMFALQLAVAAAAAWLDLAGAWLALLAVCLAVTVPAALGTGPFVRASPTEGHWVAWLFVVLATAFAVLGFAARRRLESVQQALQVRERQLSAMLEQAAAGLSVTERGRYVLVNDAFCEMVGHPREALIGRHGAEITHPDDRHLHATPLRRWAAGSPGGVVFEKRYLHRDGRVVWARIALSVVRPVGGEAPQVVALKLDITGHKRVEASLRRQREQLALVFESTGSGIWDHDLVADRPFFSDSYLRILGYPPGTKLQRLAHDLQRLHPDDRARFLAEESAMFERRVPLDIEYRLRKADGSCLWVHARGFAAWNEAGRAVRSYGAIADVSARKAAEAALVDSRARLSAVIDSALDAILAIDERGRVVLFNPAAETLFGRPAADVLGRSVLQLVPPRLRGGALERLLGSPTAPQPVPGQAGRSAMQVLHADRPEFTVDASIATVTVDAGRLATIVMRDARIRQRLDAAERARAEAEAASR
ncbi:MAG: PAS domain S-box protein, partial [Burkholderiales bacterium]